MTRKEAEEAIMEKLKEIREIALQYSPEDEYLYLFFLHDHVSIGNGAHPVKALDCWEDLGSGEGPWRPGTEGGNDAED